MQLWSVYNQHTAYSYQHVTSSFANDGVNIRLRVVKLYCKFHSYVITLPTYYSVFLLNMTLSPELTSVPLKLSILRRFQKLLPPVHITQKREHVCWPKFQLNYLFHYLRPSRLKPAEIHRRLHLLLSFCKLCRCYCACRTLWANQSHHATNMEPFTTQHKSQTLCVHLQLLFSAIMHRSLVHC